MDNDFQWVAVVDDDDGIRRALIRLMRSVGIPAQSFASGRAFLDALVHACPGCVVLDLQMPGMSGFEVQAHLAEQAPNLRVIVMSGQNLADCRERALLGKPYALLSKPANDQELLNLIALALARPARE